MMSIALGITAALSYSVFTAFAAALLLGAVAVPHAARSRRWIHYALARGPCSSQRRTRGGHSAYRQDSPGVGRTTS